MKFTDIIKKHPSWDRIIKALNDMPNTDEKTELAKSIYQFLHNAEKYYSDLEMQLFYVAREHYELKKRYELDQKLFEQLFYGKIHLTPIKESKIVRK